MVLLDSKYQSYQKLVLQVDAIKTFSNISPDEKQRWTTEQRGIFHGMLSNLKGLSVSVTTLQSLNMYMKSKSQDHSLLIVNYHLISNILKKLCEELQKSPEELPSLFMNDINVIQEACSEVIELKLH